MQTLKKIWDIASTVLVILVVLCAVFLMGSRLLGYRVFNVISGSMEPTYGVGDLIYVKEVPASEIKEGDVITFVMNEDLVVATHRVVRIDEEKQHFYTKGDANDTADSPIHFKNLIGVPQFSIPLLGYVSDFVQNPPGTYITIALGVLLIAAVFLPDLIAKKEKKDESEETDEPLPPADPAETDAAEDATEQPASEEPAPVLDKPEQAEEESV